MALLAARPSATLSKRLTLNDDPVVSDLFVLRNPKSEESSALTDFVQAERLRVGEAPRCETCRRAIGSLPWLPPYRVNLSTWGSRFGDIAFGPGDDLLVSERFAAEWNTSELVGLQGFDPAEAVRVVRHRRFDGPVPIYLRVSVTRSSTAVDESRSGIERQNGGVCPDCRLGGLVTRIRRVVLESGPVAEDVFIARGLPGIYLASRRFYTFCRANGISNAVFTPSVDYSVNWGSTPSAIRAGH
jgi:hypothetical protein